jgi:GTP diphosphokinase / guanosine-3',5'-bis(diphosphate) 3'-diphosphatase
MTELESLKGWIDICQLEWSENERALLHRALSLMNLQFTNGNISLQQASHALGVAGIVTREMSLGSLLGAVAILHNIVESRLIDSVVIAKELGAEAGNLLEGYRRISQFDVHRHTIESENFRKLLFNLSGDFRVLLVKLADRLYIVRHPDSIPHARMEHYMLESRHLYSGIAHRLGLYKIKTELEDLSLRYLEPDLYATIERRLAETQEQRDDYIRRFLQPLQSRLEASELSFEVKSRVKSATGILSKMKKQRVDFEDVMDIFAIRIIINNSEDEKTDCWRVYSIVTDLYAPNPSRMRDWISKPRSSGYESLHATVRGPEDRWVEVQVRSRRMDDEAEMGPAAHWRYKGMAEEKKAEDWILKFRELLESPGESLDAQSARTSGMYDDDIFVFTPKGDIRRLPKGASVLDFAFEIHTGLGSQCTGAEVNGKRVPIRHELQNADMVQVSTSRNQVPKRDWLSFVRTTKAKSKIRKALKEMEYAQAEFGKEILRKKLEQWKVPFNDLDVKAILQHFAYKDVLQLYQALAENRIDPGRVRQAMLEKSGEGRASLPDKPAELNRQLIKVTGLEDGALLIDNNPDIRNYQLAPCCKPGFGAEVFAFLTVGKGITIHLTSCPNAMQMRLRYPYRVMEAQWIGKELEPVLAVSLSIEGNDRVGLLNKVTDLISNKLGANLQSISLQSESGIFNGNLSLLVRDERHIERLITQLLRIDGMKRVVRTK